MFIYSTALQELLDAILLHNAHLKHGHKWSLVYV